VVSKVDYCNSVLAGAPGHLLNAAARLIFSARKREHITPLLHELHWLRVPERIKFRLCVLAYQYLHGTAPSYLAESLHLSTDVAARRRLRSAAPPTLLVLSSRRSTLGDRASPVAASRSWNSLPAAVRDTLSLLFLSAFEDITVPVIIPLLTVMYSHSASATDCVKRPCNNFIKCHFNQYFVNNNNNNNNNMCLYNIVCCDLQVQASMIPNN